MRAPPGRPSSRKGPGSDALARLIGQGASPSRPATASTTLRGEAWLLRGISSIPGELILEGRVLRFVADGSGSAWPWQLRKLERELATPGLAEAIDQGGGSVLFRWPLDTVQAWIPFHYFGGGIRLQHNDIVLSFSFGRPANMDLRIEPDADNVVDELRRQFATVRRMRESGQRWLAALKRDPSAR